LQISGAQNHLVVVAVFLSFPEDVGNEVDGEGLFLGVLVLLFIRKAELDV
jgi:hypothetical protein